MTRPKITKEIPKKPVFEITKQFAEDFRDISKRILNLPENIKLASWPDFFRIVADALEGKE